MARFRTRGHAQPLAFLRRVVESERPPHALLLSGPERVGKSTLAFDLAAGLLCLAADPGERPCRECAACRKVESGNHPDVHLLRPEGAGQQIRVGQVHQLSAELALLPLEGRFRLAIVEQAHRLNPDAQNALLKTLEEPPAAACIVLAVDDSAALLPTVVSRCARLRLAPLPADALAELLVERGAADAARASLLARLAGGRPGLALALAAAPETLVIRGRIARTLMELLAADRRRRLAAAPELLDDAASLAGLSDPAAAGMADYAEGKDSATEAQAGAAPARARRHAPAERRAAVAALIAIWRELARDLAVAARGGGSELHGRDMLDELLTCGQGTDATGMSRFLQRLDGLGRAVEAYANPELVLDTLLLEWPRRREVAPA